MNNKVIVIAGPTASGKTRLAIELAQSIGGEIVSADSMQVYCGMDIGTAKAGIEERSLVPHYMLDVADPSEGYSAAQYVEEAAACCDDILARGLVPIIAGGTGLYIDSLISGRSFAETEENRRVREALEDEYDAYGGEEMMERLREVDPDRADKLDVNDKRRIVRALEIFALTGRTATEHDAYTRTLPPRYDAARIVLTYKNRADLYARIDARVDQMVKHGLFNEVDDLLVNGISCDSTAMQAIGYKEAIEAVLGVVTPEDAIARIKQATRRYAKRQLTWFRRWEDAMWIEWDGEPDFLHARQVSTEFIRSRGIS